tara:strand:- start:2556 stop:3740 length:1185 start_codon:yes stop_codon:yes gene_type:complete
LQKGLTQVLFAMMLFALPALVSAEPAVWDGYAKRLELLRYVEYWQEPAGAVPLDSVRQLPEREWQSNGKDSVSLGYGDEVYWFRVNVRNPGAATAPLLLEIGYPVLDHIEVYLLQDGELVKRQLLGDKQPFYQRPIYHRNFLVPLSLSRDDELSIYLRVDTTSSMQVPLTLWDQDAFYVAEQARSLFEGIYYGIVLVMILYNLFVYMAVGERSFLHYVGYISAMPLFLASLHGVAFQYLWPEATWWNDQAIIVFLNLVVLFGGAFRWYFQSSLYQRNARQPPGSQQADSGRYRYGWSYGHCGTAGSLPIDDSAHNPDRLHRLYNHVGAQHCALAEKGPRSEVLHVGLGVYAVRRDCPGTEQVHRVATQPADGERNPGGLRYRRHSVIDGAGRPA